MKRILCIILTLIALILSGCSGDHTPSNEPSPYQEYIDALDEVFPFGAKIGIKLMDNKLDVDIVTSMCPVQRFGECIIATKDFCDESFDEYSVMLTSLSDKDFSTVYCWHSSNASWGILSDFRSGDPDLTMLSSVDDVYEAFPMSRTAARLKLLNEEDRKVYEESMAALNAQPDTPEEEVFAELAPTFGITEQQLYVLIKDISEKLYSSVDDISEKTPLIYPSYSESEMFDIYPNPPEVIYNTYASENGLADNIYSLTGTVIEIGVFEGGDLPIDYFILDTTHGPVLFHDIYRYTKSYNEEQFIAGGFEEPSSDYSFPDEGSYVKVYGVYSGFSDVFDMPGFFYGVPKCIISTLD